MVPAPDHMGAPSSFASRRPHAYNLPSFELPPPPLAGMQQKYQSFPNLASTQAGSSGTTLTSVGNLLTPPSNGSSDGLSPTSGITSASSQPAFTPNSAGMWPPTTSGGSPYGFPHSSQTQQQQNYGHGRGLFSPSLNSIVRGTNSPTPSDSLPPPPYEIPPYSGSSLPMSASSLPAVHSHQQHLGNMMGGHHDSGSVSQANGVGQDAYSRQPPTPTYFNGSQHHSSQSNNFSYSTGPSPTQHSPMTSGSSMKLGSLGNNGSMPPLQPQFHRTYTYPLPGPVLSNVNNPSGQMQMIGGGMHHGMMPGFNSGHAAQMHMYGHHHSHSSPQNDRPFRCDQCPQSFNRNHDLKRHKRIHLAVKPFPCGHCDKSFSRKDALKRHVLVKGCGKSHATSDIKELDGSSSPSNRSESVHNSPLVASV